MIVETPVMSDRVTSDRACPRVAAIILNWRQPADTLQCALNVARLDHENLDIIICDNASGDGSFETIRAGLAEHLDALNRERAAHANARSRSRPWTRGTLTPRRAATPPPAGSGSCRTGATAVTPPATTRASSWP
jgi:hypothetical protein